LTKADNLGLGFVVIGLLPQSGSVLAGAKLLLIWGLVMWASAGVSQLIARSVREEPEP
jgi:multicomponent Na+:H+ antiporter subunit G